MNPIRGRQKAALSGVTLTEVVIAVLIVTPLMLLLMNVFFRSVRDVTETWEETESVSVAQRLMDRIRTARWDETTPLVGGLAVSRSPVLGLEGSTFNDIDDWNGFSGADPFPAYARYNRQVTVAYVDVSAGGTVTLVGGPTAYKQVTIRVVRGTGKAVILTKIFSDALP